ncbi:MAG TPA: hypothetical protein VIM11_08750 [Tepidisphaeraceae bacterium]|jgi:hypothetical protein
MPVALSFGFLVAGCSMELETGYKYRPLNASSVQRRGYYASPYTQEKAAAEQELKQAPRSGGK